LPADDPDKHWEIERFGPIYLKWGTKYIRNEKGKIVGKEYRIHREKFHYIWVKWKVPFAGTEIYWSAEPQDNFTENREKIQKILEKKEIWPYPSKNDYLPNKDSQWKERLKQVEDAGYVLWRDPKRKQKWEMRDTKTLSLKWIHSIDGDSLPSSSDESEEEEEVKRETEIEDEV